MACHVYLAFIVHLYAGKTKRPEPRLTQRRSESRPRPKRPEPGQTQRRSESRPRPKRPEPRQRSRGLN